MNIHLSARGFALSDAIRAYAERRLRFALPLDNSAVQRVKLTLSDVNGPRGGVDKRCHLQLVHAERGTIVVEETQPDAYVAIDRASERMAMRMYRLLERRKEQRRKPSRVARIGSQAD